MNIIDNFYTPQILEDNYSFSPSGIYHSPAAATHKAFMTYIRTLPINDSPEVFGLHDNANITFLQMESAALCETLLSLQPRVVANSPQNSTSQAARSRDFIVQEVAEGILARLPTTISFDAPAHNPRNSMATVLAQEVIRYSRLLRTVNTSLRDLLNALKGFVVMSVDLDTMANSIYDNIVPTMWLDKVCYLYVRALYQFLPAYRHIPP